MGFSKEKKEKIFIGGSLAILFLLLVFIVYSLIQINHQQRQNFLKLTHDLYGLKQKADVKG